MFRIHARFISVFAVLGLALLFTACSNGGGGTRANIEGSWSITQTVTGSTRAGVAVGDEVASTIVFTVSGNSVTATNQPNGTTSSGTLNGNQVSLTRTGMDGSEAFTVTAELTFDQDSVKGTSVQTFDNGEEVRRSVSGTRQQLRY